MKNANDRKVTVRCDFADKICSLLSWVSVQLSDGYWEGEDGFYGEFWNCFDFREVSDDEFEIIIKGEPTYVEYVVKTGSFLAMSDKNVCDYIRSVVFDLMDSYDYVFDDFSSRKVLNILRDCMSDWNVTHMEMFNKNFTSIKEELKVRGFTLYNCGEPCYIAKLGENNYITVSNDFLTTQLWHIDRDITDDEFVKIVTGNDDAAFGKLYNEADVDVVSLAFALGFSGVDHEIKFL